MYVCMYVCIYDVCMYVHVCVCTSWSIYVCNIVIPVWYLYSNTVSWFLIVSLFYYVNNFILYIKYYWINLTVRVVLFAVAIPHPFPIRGHGFQYFFKDCSLFAFVDTVTGTVWQIFQDLFGRQYLSVVLKQRRQRSFQMFLDGDGSLFVVGQSRTQRISCFQCSWRGPGGGEGNRQRGWTLLPLSLSLLLLLLLLLL